MGKRLFAGGSIPVAFELEGSSVTSRGVVVANYRRAGALTTDLGRRDWGEGRS